MSETVEKVIKVVGMGQVAGNSHPIHPSTVHFPITFFTATYVLDLLYGAATNKTTSGLINSLAKPFSIDISSTLPELTRVSHYANILGIITSVPAVLTGAAELYMMIQGNGIWERIERSSDGKAVYQGMNPKVRHGLLHAALNDVAVLSAGYAWWTRRNTPDHAPSGSLIALSAGMLPGLLFSAYLGGAMVYKYGVGVMRQGEAAQIKKDMGKDELKRDEGYTKVKERKGE